MSATPNSQAIQVMNGLIQAAQQFMQSYNQLVTLQQQWTDNNVGATLALLTTAALNADGTIGANDGSPNSAHPISPTAYPSALRAVTATQVSQAKTILDGFVTYINGQAVTTQVGAHAILNAMVGG